MELEVFTVEAGDAEEEHRAAHGARDDKGGGVRESLPHGERHCQTLNPWCHREAY